MSSHWARQCSVSPQASVYASAGVSTREPTRNDMFQGEDNASFAHDLHAYLTTGSRVGK